MKSLRPKTHFVPLGDITETPHISDALAPRTVIFFTRAQGQNKQIPHQFKREIFLFRERAWSGEASPGQVLQNTMYLTTQPQISRGPACRAAVLEHPGCAPDGSQGRSFLPERNFHRKSNHACNWLQNPNQIYE